MQMETLPPKYLKPIIIQGKNYTVQGESKVDYSASSSSQQYFGEAQTTTTTTTTTSTYTAGGADFSAGGAEFQASGAEFSAGADFQAGGADFSAGAEFQAGGADYSAGAEFQASGADYSAGADFQAGGADFQAAGADFQAGGADFSAGADFQAGGADYSAGADFQAGGAEFSAGADFASMTQSNYETTQGAFESSTTTSIFGASAGSVGADHPGFKLLRRGNGITQNELNKIVSTAISVLNQGLLPVSNNTASAVKRELGGDWLVIYYPKDKAIDFNMTCVQGNDYLYFTLDDNAYQVCRLR